MQILVVEDDKDTAQFIERGLSELGHKVLSAGTGHDGLHIALTEAIDLIVLDRLLPEMDGLSVLKRLRAGGVQAPVLMLTALGRIEDRVDGLKAGADDYLIKPFAFSELAARIDALARRAPMQDVVTRLELGLIAMDLLKHEVRCDGQVIPLQPREFRLLEELMRNAGHVVTRTMLLEKVWDVHFDPQTNIVDTHMSRLRSKLNEGGAPDLIETVRGVGYRMRSL